MHKFLNICLLGVSTLNPLNIQTSSSQVPIFKSDKLHVSQLKQRPSSVTSACYLLNGLPRGVFGSWFVYSQKGEKQIEDRVNLILDKSRKTNCDALRRSLEYLASSVYVDSKAKPVFVFSKDRCALLVKELNREIKEVPYDRETELIALSVSYYLNFDRKITVANIHLSKLAKSRDSFGSILFTNLKIVGAELRIEEAVNTTFMRPELLR